MKNVIIVLSLMFIIPMYSCSSSRDVSERRALMMPKTSEIPRNKKKYREVEHSKRSNYNTKKTRERR